MKTTHCLYQFDFFANRALLPGTVRYGPGTFEDAIDLLARGKIDIAPLITATYPLTKIQDALAAQIAREGIKIVLMNQE